MQGSDPFYFIIFYLKGASAASAPSFYLGTPIGGIYCISSSNAFVCGSSGQMVNGCKVVGWCLGKSHSWGSVQGLLERWWLSEVFFSGSSNAMVKTPRNRWDSYSIERNHLKKTGSIMNNPRSILSSCRTLRLETTSMPLPSRSACEFRSKRWITTRTIHFVNPRVFFRCMMGVGQKYLNEQSTCMLGCWCPNFPLIGLPLSTFSSFFGSSDPRSFLWKELTHVDTIRHLKNHQGIHHCPWGPCRDVRGRGRVSGLLRLGLPQVRPCGRGHWHGGGQEGHPEVPAGHPRPGGHTYWGWRHHQAEGVKQWSNNGQTMVKLLLGKWSDPLPGYIDTQLIK